MGWHLIDDVPLSPCHLAPTVPQLVEFGVCSLALRFYAMVILPSGAHDGPATGAHALGTNVAQAGRSLIVQVSIAGGATDDGRSMYRPAYFVFCMPWTTTSPDRCRVGCSRASVRPAITASPRYVGQRMFLLREHLKDFLSLFCSLPEEHAAPCILLCRCVYCALCSVINCCKSSRTSAQLTGPRERPF